MRNEIVSITETVMRKLGGAVNLVLLAGFIYVAWRLKVTGLSFFEAAGGMPAVTSESITALAQDPEIGRRAAYWAAAWFCAVGACGSAFMAVLGVRWAFHASLRTVGSLRG